MTGRRIHDYTAMETRYVQTDESIRSVSREFDAAFSSVAKIAKKDGWDEKRAKFKAALEARTVDAMSRKRAEKVEAIMTDFLETLHVGVQQLGLSMVDRWEAIPRLASGCSSQASPSTHAAWAS